MSGAERFTSVLLSGHKGCACEVPFDPAARWSVPAIPLWPGRRGHHVRGTLNGVAFTSAVVARSRRFWVLIDAAVQQKARITVGEVATLAIAPREPPSDALPKSRPKPARKSPRRATRKSAARRRT